MNEIIKKYLINQGYSICSEEYYKLIKLWAEMLKNKNSYVTYHDPSGKQRKMNLMGMAKRVAEDWASILYSEKNDIISTKTIDSENVEQNQKNTKLLQKRLKDIKFFKSLIKVITKASALGTAGMILRIKNIDLDVNGNLTPNKRTKYSLIKVPANQIIPLKVENEEIIDCAFISENTVNGEKEYYIEIHKLIYDEKNEQEVYEIENIYIDKNGNEIPKNIPRKYSIGSNIPLFAIIKPPIDNPYVDEYGETGLGFSVYSDGIDQIKFADIAFHNFVMDYFLGGKKVFYNKKLTKTESYETDGKEVIVERYPDDEIRQQFRQIGDEIENANAEDLIKEYNPKLRIDENVAGLQTALNLVSFKCGLGAHYYRISDDGKIVTATEYEGSKQDLVENANKYRTELSEFINQIGRAILFVERTIFNEDVDENCEVVIENSDGYMVNTESAKKDFREEVAQGLRFAYEYRMRFCGEDEQTAKAKIAEAERFEIKIENEE